MLNKCRKLILNKENLEKKIEEFEKSTGAELVVFLSDKKLYEDPHIDVYLFWGALTAYALLNPNFYLYIFLALTLLIILGLFIYKNFLGHKSKIINENLEKEASLTFLNEGLSETKERKGILLFISPRHHKIYTIFDTGINKLLSASDRSSIVDLFSQSIQKNGLDKGVTEGISLMQEFLISKNIKFDYIKNELPNEVRK